MIFRVISHGNSNRKWPHLHRETVRRWHVDETNSMRLGGREERGLGLGSSKKWHTCGAQDCHRCLLLSNPVKTPGLWLFVLFPFLCFFSGSEETNISTFWGENHDDFHRWARWSQVTFESLNSGVGTSPSTPQLGDFRQSVDTQQRQQQQQHHHHLKDPLSVYNWWALIWAMAWLKLETLTTHRPVKFIWAADWFIDIFAWGNCWDCLWISFGCKTISSCRASGATASGGPTGVCISSTCIFMLMWQQNLVSLTFKPVCLKTQIKNTCPQTMASKKPD